MIAVKGIFILLIDRMPEVRFYFCFPAYKKIFNILFSIRGEGMSGGLKMLCFSFNSGLSADYIPEFSGIFLSYRSNFPDNTDVRLIKEENNAIEIPMQRPVSLIFNNLLKNRRFFRPTES